MREALAWRMAELSRASLESYENEKIVTAVLLTRGVVETSAALWYLRDKIDSTLEGGVLGDVDDYLMKLLMGSKVYIDILPESINVLTFVKNMDKDFKGFQHEYNVLSEYAHPNWAGTTHIYSKIDKVNMRANYGVNIDSEYYIKQRGLNILGSSPY